MNSRSWLRLLVIAALFTLLIPLAVATPAASADGDDDQFTPPPEKTELKYPNLGSHLDQLVASVEAGEASAEDAAADTPVHSGGAVAVTIYLSGNVDDVVAFLEDNGGDPRNVGQDYIEAYVPVTLLGSLSEQPGVIRVREIVPPEPDFGPITSQGVQAHGSLAWNQDGYTGEGVRVGIIDGGFEGYSDLIESGELPEPAGVRCYTGVGEYTENLADCEVDSLHGTAVAETVMDIAPQVSLYITNAPSWGDQREAAAWMVREGVSVINRSQSSGFDGPGDGTYTHSNSILKTVDEAVEGGIIWVNAAGNQARRTWFGEYSDANGNEWIEFSGDDQGIDLPPLEAGDEFYVRLRWEDNWGGATRDFDLYVVKDDNPREVLASSYDPQSGGAGHNPYEFLVWEVPSDTEGEVEYDVRVRHTDGSEPAWIQVMVRGTSGTYVPTIEHYTEHGSMTSPGEGRNPGMLAVGAAPWYDVNTIEYYSSRGPTPDGRVKPDIVGADCGETVTYEERVRDSGDSCWFSGTSQAAPHVAGLAALVKQRFPNLTPVQVAAYLKDNAEARGTVPNNTWGHGFAMLPASDPRDRAKEYVEEAIRAYREDPEAAKAYYQSADSVITELGLYLILLDGNTIVVNIGFPGAVGADITGRIGTDAIGNEYGKELAAADEQGTFVDYLIPDPLDDYRIYRKRTYAVRHDRLVFASGSWDKDPATEDSLSDPDHVVATIYKAGARLFREGPGPTFEYYNTLASIDGERYVFIAARDGVIVADATMPELVGTNISNLQASDDPDLGQKIAALQEDDERWFPHMWRNPVSGQEEQKNTYVTRFRGIIFGSGYYGDTQPLSTDPCGQALTGDGAIPGTWASGCDSETLAQDGSGAYPHARFYTFTLAQQAEVTITLDSNDADTLLYLRQGDARSGTALHENDDHQGSRSKSQIQETLAAGAYTIEATTYAAVETGVSFTLTLSGLGTAAMPPGPTPSDPCGETVTGDGAIPGTWASGCYSETPGRGHARYYNFTLAQQSEVTITLDSNADTYLYLRDGDARSGDFLHENDDHQGSRSKSQIQETLAAGTYTIEATTYNPGKTGSFTLTLSGLGTAAMPPGPTPSDPCGETVSGDRAIPGMWASGCDSETVAQDGSGSYPHARFYTFTLAQSSEVTIALDSNDADTLLYLRQGDARSGTALHENDDHQGSRSKSQIQETLAADTYTIEATTYAAVETGGGFTLTLSGLGTTAMPTQSCSVGQTLAPGDQCSHQDFSIEVDSSGTVIMRFTGNRVELNNLSLVRSGNSWDIESLP